MSLLKLSEERIVGAIGLVPYGGSGRRSRPPAIVLNSFPGRNWTVSALRIIADQSIRLGRDLMALDERNFADQELVPIGEGGSGAAS